MVDSYKVHISFEYYILATLISLIFYQFIKSIININEGIRSKETLLDFSTGLVMIFYILFKTTKYFINMK